jgi:RNA-binding protein
MAQPLTTRERAHLKARAHALEPVVHVGASGVTDRLVAEVERALAAHELIKVKVATDDRAARVAIGDEICDRTGATAVHRVGKVVILWRAREDQPSAPASE